jgi:multidrug efflux pump subunit AcrA (membrane-fusion protein)
MSANAFQAEEGSVRSQSALDPDWDSVEEFLASIERQSFLDLPREQFFESLTQGLSVITSVTDFNVRLRWANHLEEFGSFGSPISDAALSAASPEFLQPGQTRSSSRQPADQSLILAQHCFDAGVVVEMLARYPASSAQTIHRLRELLETLAVIIGNFSLRMSIRQLSEQERLRKSVDQLVRDLSAAENGHERSHQLCEIVQRLLEVDRVTLVRVRLGQARLLGSSAAGTISDRSRSLQLLRALMVSAHRQAILVDVVVGHTFHDTENAVEGLCEYIDDSDVRVLRGIPLEEETAGGNAPQTYLVLEHFSADWPTLQQKAALDLAFPHVQDSARRLVQSEESTWGGRLGIWVEERRRWKILGAAVLVVLLGLVLIPFPLKISAEGTLQPDHRQSLFAPTDGIVERIEVSHGEHVKAGQVLLVLRDPKLEIEERRILGEIETLRARLDGLNAARIRNRDVESRTSRDTELSAQESDLQAQLGGLRTQLALVQEQKSLLTITSPMEGQINRWDLQQAFPDRPVVHGQFLLDVQDVDGGWNIELEVPDDDAGYVFESQQRAPCAVDYLFRTSPGQRYQTKLHSVSAATQLGEDRLPVVLAQAPAAPADASQLRVGASVLARVDCGRHSLGYVLFRQVLEFLQRVIWL